MARGKHGRRHVRRGWKIALVVVGVLSVMGAGTAYAAYRYDASAADRILPGVRVAGIDVSGMTRSQALREVTAVAQETLQSSLSVSAGGHEWVVTPAALGMTADVDGAVDEAFALADSMPLMTRIYHRVSEKPVDASFDLAFEDDVQQVESFVAQARDEVAVPAVDARFALVENQLVMRRPETGQELKGRLAVSRIRDALASRTSAVEVPLRVIEPEVTIPSLGKTIVVDLSSNTLQLYEGFKVEAEYRVATAAAGYETPIGTWKIVDKRENPTWYNPALDSWGADLPRVIGPGPDNPLGTRALYLNAPGIRIHGTYNSGSIGTYASHGCIRMLVSESEQLFPLVPVGTRVIVMP
jgi:lipoprotein-anchoring transpeptidase ErfK/SrfK